MREVGEEGPEPESNPQLVSIEEAVARGVKLVEGRSKLLSCLIRGCSVRVRVRVRI